MKLHKLALALGVIFSGGMVITACSDGGGGNTVLVPTGSSLTDVSTPIRIVVEDQNGDPIPGAVVKLTNVGSGTDAKYAVDPVTKKALTSSVTLVAGELLLALSDAAASLNLTADPIDFNVMVTADGYMPTGKTAIITALGSAVDVVIPMKKLTVDTAKQTTSEVTLADGSKATVTTAPLASNATDAGVAGNVLTLPSSLVSSTGVAQGTVTISTPTTTTATSSTAVQSQASITVSKGTKMTDASGNAITGKITANVISYAPTQETALAAFPGGLAVSVAPSTTATNTVTAGSFVSGGFTAINLVDESGKTVKNFVDEAGNPKEIDASITVPKGTINPDTGVEVKPGDTMPIWSYDETKGTWVKEKEGFVDADPLKATDAAGNWIVQFKVSHLSYWNMDWFATKNCDKSLNVSLASTSAPMSTVPYLLLKAKFVHPTTRAELQGYLYTGYLTANDMKFKVVNVPADYDLQVEAWLPDYSQRVASNTYSDFCSGGAKTLTVNLPKATVATTTVAGSVYEACFNAAGVEVTGTRRPLYATARLQRTVSGKKVFEQSVGTVGGAFSLTSVPVNTGYKLRITNGRNGDARVTNNFAVSNSTPASVTVFPMNCIAVSGGGFQAQ